ncbi:hypothetical protein [Nocardia crassostreae]|uniref:hypothetical protein n=1 Tax=Nocardia crassostreae TaxID=53428 RepID=UPI00082DC652|nr:hypothetical protein [Nocardia crassostreae]
MRWPIALLTLLALVAGGCDATREGSPAPVPPAAADVPGALRGGLEQRGFDVVGEVPDLSVQPQNIGSGVQDGRMWTLPGFDYTQLNAALRMTEVGILAGAEIGWIHVNIYEYAGSIPAGADPCHVPWDRPESGADCLLEQVAGGDSVVVFEYANLREVYVILGGTVVGTITAAGALDSEPGVEAPIVDRGQQWEITEELAAVVR